MPRLPLTRQVLKPLHWLWSSRGSLKEKALRGGVWLVLGDAAARLAGILKLAVLARLIAPGEFGLFGAAAMVMQLVEYFTDTSFRVALVRQPGDIRDYLGTVWTVQMLRGAALAVLVFALAPLGAGFFDLPAVVPVVRALAVIMLVRGLSNPAVVYLRRELDFRTEAAWKLSGPAAGLAAAVLAAAFTPSVWALVTALVASQAAETVASFLVSPVVSRPAFRWARIRELTGFVKWVFWSNIISYFETYLDSAVVGRALGARSLGFYQVAMQSSALPAAQVGMQVGGVMYPAFSKLSRREELGRAFVKTVTLLVGAVLPLGCALTVMAPQFVTVFLGTRWLEAAAIVRVVIWGGVAVAAIRVGQACLLAAGRPDVNTKIALLRVVLMMSLLYPLLRLWGLPGAATAVACSAVAALLAQTLVLARMLGLGGRELLGATKEGALASLPAAAALAVGSSTTPAAIAACGAAVLGSGLILLLRLPPYLRSAGQEPQGRPAP